VTIGPRRLLPGVLAALTGAVLVACGSSSATTDTPIRATASTPATTPTSAGATTAVATTRTVTRRPRSTAPLDRYPQPLRAAWQVVARVRGRPAVWVALRAGVTLVRMNQALVHLGLHAGSEQPGGTGWHYGPEVAGGEIHHLIMGFNGGFKLNIAGSGGFLSYGRIGAPLLDGLGSIVTYRDGATQIGAWRRDVPARRRPIASVRQNLHLLIDGGRANPTVLSCGSSCWGATIGGAVVARSGLAIRRDGELLWAAGENLTVAQLANAMIGAGAIRGVELDINPDWVAAYVYIHHRSSSLTAVPFVPGQLGIAGHLLSPYARDFFTVLSN
jgi:hypothetical protein